MTLPVGYQGLAAVSGRQFSAHRKALTIKGYDPQEQKDWTFDAYRRFDNVVGVPRAYAKEKGIGYDTTLGYELEPPNRPDFTGKWEYQEAPVAEAVATFKTGVTDIIYQAYTGSGKTVMGCEIACRLGVSTLILVDQNKLLRQWKETLTEFFGYHEGDIGIVQGGTVDIENDFTIGMIQSVYDKEFDPEFYEAFGMVIFDECHVVGAEQFSNVLEMFPARYRMGMSATPDRKDSMAKVLKMHLESQRVVLKEQRKQSRVYVVQNKATYSWYANTSPKTGRFISEVAEDGQRNAMINEVVKWFYEHDRNALIIGERIAHLENLAALAVMSGIPEEDICLYTGKEHYYKLEKDPQPSRDPTGYVRDTEYSPVHLAFKERRVNLERRDDQLRERRLIFSTYSVFSKGVDVPHLDAGIDVTPRSAFVQTHGRVLRKASGKKIPIWVTIRDYDSYRAEYQFGKRIAEFVKSNAELFIWPTPGEGELVRKNPAALRREVEARCKKLKNVRIETDAGGNSILQTPITAPGSGSNSVKRTTAKRDRSRRSSRRAS